MNLHLTLSPRWALPGIAALALVDPSPPPQAATTDRRH